MQPEVPGLRALLVTIVAFGMLHACAVSTALQGRPGVDIATIERGTSREDVEQLLGPPEREWKSVQGVTYCLYEFDGGVPPNPGAALLFLIADIGTAGVTEVMARDASPDELVGSAPETRIISFDVDGKVLEILKWADQIPPSGVPEMNMQRDPLPESH